MSLQGQEKAIQGPQTASARARCLCFWPDRQKLAHHGETVGVGPWYFSSLLGINAPSKEKGSTIYCN